MASSSTSSNSQPIEALPLRDQMIIPNLHQTCPQVDSTDIANQLIIPSLDVVVSSCPTPTNNTSDIVQASPNDIIAAPEKELIMCAVKLAALEKLATGLGVLGFMVATVVLLGGLLTLLELEDFVLIGLMLFIEGIRIFCRMHCTPQLMMQNICFISCLFYWFQIVTVIIIGALSAMRLASQDFDTHVLLAKKAFFEWKVSYCELLKKVNNECGLGPSDMVAIERFFNDAYSKSVTGSIFDALKMDLVTFAGEFLVSSVGEEQLMGVRTLKALSIHEHLSDATLRKIGASTAVIKRLIQMQTYNNIFEENIRNSANEIVRKLAHKEPKVLGMSMSELWG
ncbi:hypothetical protein FCM35_KLT16449 [Carex littledalei]|uniref:Uncharacterized protein n=1 Tax=Carex littledalei TaxID=544730 RepID=A0A833RPQ4_9POAL|nr:hypothetical protein FCM35_KLT16449 [Carex littledalei]